MDCYKFEHNITKFIDNQLKYDFRKLFLEHTDNCEKCRQKLKDISNNIITFNQFKKLKTSDKFLDGLNQKIYDFNNNSSILEKIKGFKVFEIPPIYIPGYAAVLLLFIFSSYSLINMDRTNYENLNNRVTASLKENINKDTKQNIVDEDYGIKKPLIADANNSNNVQMQKRFTLNHGKSNKSPILPVSNNNSQSKRSNQRMGMSDQGLLEYSNRATNGISQTQKFKNIKEDYIINYEHKNKYFQKRKDSLKNILNNSSDKKIVEKIQKQIHKDSLDQLEFYRNFDRIMIQEDPMNKE
tara:strand:+ start:819 stop:1709 length:891 start_codon:yes stop_codon:yes gene_type:complete